MRSRNGITKPVCSTGRGLSPRRILKSILLFLIFGFLTACGGTIDSELTHNKYPVEESLPETRYDLTALLLIPAEMEDKVFNELEIGDGLTHLLRETLKEVFVDVVVQDADKEFTASGYGILLYPEFVGETQYFELKLTGKDPLTQETIFQVETHGRSTLNERTLNPAMDVAAALRTLGLSTPSSIDDYREAQYRTKISLERSIIAAAIKLANAVSTHPSLAQNTRVQPEDTQVAFHQKKKTRLAPGTLSTAGRFLNDPREQIPIGKSAGRDDIALLIGNRTYLKKGIPKVEHAHRDLEMIKTYLIRTMGFYPDNIITYEDATKGDFATLFGTAQDHRGKLFRWVKPGVSRVFIYYTGHGIPGVTGEELYFVPVDADLDYISQSGFSVSLFYENLKKIPSQETVIVLDTCFSGRTPDGVLFNRASAIVPVPQSRPMPLSNTAVLTSAQNDQVSTWLDKQGHSLFTYFFLLGLKGQADLNQDRTITTGEMNEYLIQEVPYMARRVADKEQLPKLEGRKDLVLAILED
ncbi:MULTISPECIES: caspase family protein [unclassified Nitrospina]|uniref:caspase family protein n=1 Tax=unclassified Nitrospina TaxID=2638683 RepID=UPI003F9A2F40